MNVHPTSYVAKEAIIEDGVEVGPFCVINGKSKIGSGSRLISHVTIGSDSGSVEIGKDNVFYAGTAIGGPPQDKKYKGEDTRLIIGDGNQFRECVTLSLGTMNGGGVTKIGDNNLIMAYSHFGHDSCCGNNNVIANSTQLAGHVSIENNVIVGGMCAINQFARLGNFSFIGGYSAINKDILPYSIAQGNYAGC
jgi:UDP-N-acetylglucosamine acyltransferase